MYRHRQLAWVTFGVGLAFALAFAVLAPAEARFLGAIPLALLGAWVPIFGWLTVEVDEDEVRARFGVGLFRRRVGTALIVSVAPVRNSWISGWGMRKIRSGWLWNVSGLDAVELRLMGGQILRIGTDEPEALAAAIRRAAPRATAGPSVAPDNGGWGLALVVGLALPLLVAGATVLAVRANPSRIVVDADEILADGGGYHARVDRSDVRTVELVDALPSGLVRTNGYGDGRLILGHARATGLGAGDVFVDTAAPPYVLVTTADRFLLFNGRTAGETRTLLAALRR